MFTRLKSEFFKRNHWRNTVFFWLKEEPLPIRTSPQIKSFFLIHITIACRTDAKRNIQLQLWLQLWFSVFRNEILFHSSGNAYLSCIHPRIVPRWSEIFLRPVLSRSFPRQRGTPLLRLSLVLASLGFHAPESLDWTDSETSVTSRLALSETAFIHHECLARKLEHEWSLADSREFSFNALATAQNTETEEW